MPARTHRQIWRHNANRLTVAFSDPANPVPAPLMAWFRYQTTARRPLTSWQVKRLTELQHAYAVWRPERHALMCQQRRKTLRLHAQPASARARAGGPTPPALKASNDAVSAATAAATAQRAAEALASGQVSPRWRPVLEARVAYPGANLAELAEQLGVTKDAVAGRLRRALASEQTPPVQVSGQRAALTRMVVSAGR